MRGPHGLPQWPLSGGVNIGGAFRPLRTRVLLSRPAGRLAASAGQLDVRRESAREAGRDCLSLECVSGFLRRLYGCQRFAHRPAGRLADLFVADEGWLDEPASAPMAAPTRTKNWPPQKGRSRA